MSGKLSIIATPIGNLSDLSFRALETLKSVEALACEDTRVTRKLLNHYEIPVPSFFFSCHDHNERQVVKRILGLLEAGHHVGLCSDAGYPGISDPGYVVVSESKAAGYTVEVIPGPSAVPLALISSGLPTSSYIFKGFTPRKPGKRRKYMALDQESPHTQVYYESKYRIKAFLKDALEVFGNRRAAVCLELTKKFETVYGGDLAELLAQLEDLDLRGEIAVVIAGHHPDFYGSPVESCDEEP